MPIYMFECDNCGNKFEKKMSFENYKIPKECNKCKCKDKIFRDYISEDHSFFGPQRTLGSQADKNSAKLSKDEKEAINRKNNAYKNLGSLYE